MSRLWAKLFARARDEDAPEAVEPQEAVEAQPTIEAEALGPPEVAPQPVAVEPEPEPERAPTPALHAEPTDPEAPDTGFGATSDGLTAADVEARLTDVLESLGSAHRRPFVRNG